MAVAAAGILSLIRRPKPRLLAWTVTSLGALMVLFALLGWRYYNNAAGNDAADRGLAVIKYGVATTSVGAGVYVVIGAGSSSSFPASLPS